MALIRRFTPLLAKVIRVYPIPIQSQKIHRWVAPTLRELKNREEKLGGKKTYPRNTYLEWNLEAELFAFGQRLNEDFDPDLLLQAFTDRSYVIKEEMKQKEMGIDIKMNDNRELAKKGEEFMNKYIQSYLEIVLPKYPLEGIKAVHRHLTSDAVYANISLHLGTKDIILANQYPVDESVLANTFKAIVSVLLESSGEERAALFVRDFVITQLQGQDINEFWQIDDPWDMLKTLVEKDGAKVEPRLIGEAAKNTLLACYQVGLYVDRKMISSGFGETVATAKEMAARAALKKIFGTEDSMKPIDFKLERLHKPTSQMRYQISAS